MSHQKVRGRTPWARHACLLAVYLLVALTAPGRAEEPTHYETLAAHCKGHTTHWPGAGREHHSVRCVWAGPQSLTDQCTVEPDGTRTARLTVTTQMSTTELTGSARIQVLERLRTGRRLTHPAAGFDVSTALSEQTALLGHLHRCAGGAHPDTFGERIPAGLDGIAWVERYSSTGPCHWLGLAPVEATTTGPNRRQPVQYDARRTRTAPAPVILAECCTAAPDVAPRPLLAWLEIDPLPGDPHPHMLLNPGDWAAMLFDSLTAAGPHFEAVVEGAWRSDGPAASDSVTIRGMLVRPRTSYNTRTRYQLRLGPAVLRRMLRHAGRHTLSLRTRAGRHPPLSASAHYITGPRTQRFMDACRTPP